MNCSTCGIIMCATLVHKNMHTKDGVSANAQTDTRREREREGEVQISREGTERFGIS